MKRLVTFVIAAIVATSLLNTASAQTHDVINYNGGTLPALRDKFVAWKYPYDQGDIPVPREPSSVFSWVFNDNNIINVYSNVAGGVYGGFGGFGTVKQPGQPYDEYEPVPSSFLDYKVNNNTVNVEGGNGNGITIGSPSSMGNVTGGWSRFGAATNNTVNVNNAAVRGLVVGGWVDGSGVPDSEGGVPNNSNSGLGSQVNEVRNNKVIIDSKNNRLWGNIYGGYSQGSRSENYADNGGNNIANNTVEIKSGVVNISGTPKVIAGAYSALGTNGVDSNTVTITGTTKINSATTNIYGGRGQSASTITNNGVYITGGDLTIQGIYGGQNFNGRGNVKGNIIEITGGKVTAETLYGSYRASSSSNAMTEGATDNTVTISIDENNGVFGSVFGGEVRSGAANVFTNNIFNKNNTAKIDTVKNFQTINFGYTGNANIDNLYTTPTGETGGITNAGVIFDMFDHTIVFNDKDADNIADGNIIGSGSLTIKSTADSNPATNPMLIMEGKIDIAKEVNVTVGTLQLGNGKYTGEVAGTSDIILGDNTTLAYNRSDDITETNKITDADSVTTGGKVVQRGTGTLIVSNADNNFTGGTEIESGTLRIVDAAALNMVNGNTGRSKQGFVTFTQSGDKKVELTAPMAGTMPGSNTPYVYLANSFRTDTTATDKNELDLASPNAIIAPSSDTITAIMGVVHDSKGGAFYVAEDTSMDVTVDALMLASNTADNGSGTVSNDLFVEDGGTFNMHVGSMAVFQSGIDGEGTLNFNSVNLNDPNQSAVGIVQFASGTTAKTYHTGNTNITGDKNHAILLDLARQDASSHQRIKFEHSGNFTIDGGITNPLTDGYSAGITGGGIIEAANIVVKDGALLAPFKVLDADGKPSTLTLDAENVSLNNFALTSQVSYTAGFQAPLTTDSESIPVSNNDLLYIDTGTTNKVHLGNGMIYLRTGSGQPFVQGDYLLVKSTNGYQYDSDVSAAENWTDLTDDDILKKLVKVNIDGFSLENVKGGTARGSYEIRLGDEPNNLTGEYQDNNVDKNIWLTHKLNSLTMTLDESMNDITDLTALFKSKQKESTDTDYEQIFLSGDKVHLAGDDASVTKEIELTGNNTSATSRRIVVSGLVVGQDVSAANTTGSYRVTGSGGIISDPNSAFGRYSKQTDGDSTLGETGKLEKFGTGTLTFENTGGNNFMQGIELSGGTLGFDLANQLGDGGNGITFLNNAEMQANASVELGNDIRVRNSSTATFLVDDADPATVYPDSKRGLFLTGSVDGNGNIEKTGDGVLQFAANSTNSNTVTSIVNTDVKEGKFRVTGGMTYGSTGTFTVDDGAELSGGGTVVANEFAINGKIASDKTIMSPTIMASEGAERIATLTLQGTGATDSVEFGSTFQFDYRVTGVNDSTNPNEANDTLNDLLKLTQMQNVTFYKGGTINITTDMGSLTKGDYLIIDSNIGMVTDGSININGIANTDGALEAKLNGNDLMSGGPRGTFEFEFRIGTAANSQLWLTTDHHTLETTWQGGDNTGTNRDGVWGSGTWLSTQVEGGIKDASFFDGDTVYFNDFADTDKYTVSIRAEKIVSGMNVDTNKDIVFDGSNGITAKTNDTNLMVGNYINTAAGTAQRFDSTGKLVKSGTGTATFANGDSSTGNTFNEGIDIAAGTIAFNRVNQLGTNSNGITFTDDAGGTTGTLKPNADNLTLNEKVNIENGVTGAFEVGEFEFLGVNMPGNFTYTGTLTNSNAESKLNKTGVGNLILNETTSGYTGKFSVEEGTMIVKGNYGTSTGADVLNGATLSGTGTIGGNTVVQSGGILKPNNMLDDTMSSLQDGQLTIMNGDLTFNADSIFSVSIAQTNDQGEEYLVVDDEGKPVYDEGTTNQAKGYKRETHADKVTVKGSGTNVTINQGAKLDVEISYWDMTQTPDDYNADTSGHFTIIDADTTSTFDPNAKFTFNETPSLPRGVQLMQGWTVNETYGTNDYQLWFEVLADGEGGFGDICYRNNRIQIGNSLDWFIANGDAGLRDVIDHLSDMTDAEACEAMDQIHGDLTSNAMFLALKEPWRHSFNRLGLSDPRACDPCASVACGSQYKRQMWGEFTARYEDTGYDDNAHAFTVNRYGVAVGVDQQLSQSAAVGANFQYSDPILRQATGRVDASDYEFGLYGMKRLTSALEMKAYLGYAHQTYDFARSVFIPATANFNALSEQLSGSTSGDSLSASLEFVRPIRWNKNVRLLPVMAFDYEKAWMNGFSETGGTLALSYDDSSFERMMLRVGLGGEMKRDDLTLHSRLQYAVQLNDAKMPRMGVRFVEGGVSQPTADIWGSRIGSDYINWGIGANWNLSKSRTVYVNYDAKWYDRSTLHIGEAGVVKTW